MNLVLHYIYARRTASAHANTLRAQIDRNIIVKYMFYSLYMYHSTQK